MSSGWKGESQRHRLARMRIKSCNKNIKVKVVNHKNRDKLQEIARKPNDKITLDDQRYIENFYYEEDYHTYKEWYPKSNKDSIIQLERRLNDTNETLKNKDGGSYGSEKYAENTIKFDKPADLGTKKALEQLIKEYKGV
jgi:hypothetical protein